MIAKYISKYKKIILFIVGIIIIIAISFIVLILNMIKATENYNIAVFDYNDISNTYDRLATQTSISNIEGLDETAPKLDIVDSSFGGVCNSFFNGNSTNKINRDITTIEELKDALNEKITIIQNIMSPQQDWLIERLSNVEGVMEVEPVTKNNDPDGLLGGIDGYTACLYFIYYKVNQDEIRGQTAVEKGTAGGGAIEVYATLEDAENRCDYLSGFDDTILYSGSYAIVGNMVIRTSFALSDDEQFELTDRITRELTRVK